MPEEMREGPEKTSMERMIKLALTVREHEPVSFSDIRRMLPLEYPPSEGGSAAERKKRDDAVRRCFVRDKRELAAHGIVLVADDEYRYSIDRDASYSSPVYLSESEAALLRCLCVSLLDDESFPLKGTLRTALAKIGDEIELPDMLPEGLTPSDGPVKGLGKIEKALYTHRPLAFRYRDREGNETEREVEPSGFFLHDKNSYLVAYDPAAESERTFRLDRMSGARVVSDRSFEPRDFDVSDYCLLPFQYGEPLLEAQVRFSPERGADARRLSANDRGRLYETDDGGFLWEVEAASPELLANWCVQQGEGVVPAAPETAVSACEDGVRAALAAAGGADGEGADDE